MVRDVEEQCPQHGRSPVMVPEDVSNQPIIHLLNPIIMASNHGISKHDRHHMTEIT
jgi:hypothetical protein